MGRPVDTSLTGRGFRQGHFLDANQAPCSLQESSSAMGAKIWLGVDDASIRILAQDAAAMGRDDLLPLPGTPGRLTGWVDWRIPPQVFVSSRMHLTQAMVKSLLPALQHFAETGDLP